MIVYFDAYQFFSNDILQAQFCQTEHAVDLFQAWLQVDSWDKHSFCPFFIDYHVIGRTPYFIFVMLQLSLWLSVSTVNWCALTICNRKTNAS